MAPASVVGALIGGVVSGAIPGDALLIAIGVTLIVFGAGLPPGAADARPRPAHSSYCRSALGA